MDDVLRVIAEQTRRIPVPEGYRELWAGEHTRKGDMMTADDSDEWFAVSDARVGTTVPPFNAENLYVRCCRPVPPDFKNWYVSTGINQPNGNGTRERPFASLEAALLAITTDKREPKHGVIWTTTGSPMHILEDEDYTRPPHTPIKMLEESDVFQIPPGYRQLMKEEYVRRLDIVWAKGDDGKRRWRTADRKFGGKRCSNVNPAARKIEEIHPNFKKHVHDRMVAAEKAALELLAEVRSLMRAFE